MKCCWSLMLLVILIITYKASIPAHRLHLILDLEVKFNVKNVKFAREELYYTFFILTLIIYLNYITILLQNLSKGVTGSRQSSATIVPSFRFNKADDQMVEVTPSSSFDEMDEVISHADFGSVQDSSYTQMKPTQRENDHFYDDVIDTGSSSLIDFGSIDEFYGAGENVFRRKCTYLIVYYGI